MTQKKYKRTNRSFRQRRTAAIVAAVLALGMIISIPFIYADYIFGERQGQPGNDIESLVEHYRQQRDYCKQQIESLSEALEITDPPNPAILRDIAVNYRGLIDAQTFLDRFDEKTDLVEDYRQELVQVYQKVIELEPLEQNSYLGLLEQYIELGDDSEAPLETALILRDLLRQDANIYNHLMMLSFLELLELDELFEEETLWLRSSLEDKLHAGELSNESRYYYAVLLDLFEGEPELAREHLLFILDNEDEGSLLYTWADEHLNYIDSRNDEGDNQENEESEESSGN